MDDSQTQVEEPQVEETQVEAPEQVTEETPEVSAPSQEEPETETEEQPPAPAEEPVEEQDPQPMSRRKAERLEKLEALAQRLRGPEQSAPRNPQGINYQEMIDADPQTLQQLEQKSKEFGESQYNAGLEQAKSIQFHTRLEIDAPRVESKHPQFNPSSPDFVPGAVSAVNQLYLALTGYDPKTDTVSNPNLRYADFADAIMELSGALEGQRTVKTTQNIAKQAANTGLRPDGSSARRMDLTKDPSQMTDAELKAAVDLTMPTRDARGRFLKT